MSYSNMPTYTSELNLGVYVKNDTLEPILVDLNGQDNEIDLTGAVIKMQFRDSADDISLSPSTTITDESNGIFQINRTVLAIDEGKHTFDITIDFASGKVRTYVVGWINIVEGI